LPLGDRNLIKFSLLRYWQFIFQVICLGIFGVQVWAQPIESIESSRSIEVDPLAYANLPDWAIRDLQSLVARSGAVTGNIDRSLTRAEFAVNLNAVISQVDRLSPQDRVMLQRLETEFSAELANLRERAYLRVVGGFNLLLMNAGKE
jgi:hypothetical protein